MLVVLQRKPTGGDRDISLTPVLTRVAGRIRCGPVREWADGYVGFWDSAVASSSPLRESLGRMLQIEAVHFSAAESILGFVDLHEFYAMMDLCRLFHYNADGIYPTRVLLLLLCFALFLSPRYLLFEK